MSTITPMPKKGVIRDGFVGFFCELPKGTARKIAGFQRGDTKRKWQVIREAVDLLEKSRQPQKCGEFLEG